MLAPAQIRLTTERRSLGALADLVEPWRTLAANAAEPNVFYDPDFALAAAPAFGRGVEAVLVWADPRRLVGLFPLIVARHRYGVGPAVAVGWVHPFAPLGTPLVDRDAADAAVAAFLDHVAGDGALPKLLLLPYLREGGPVALALASGLAQHGGVHAVFARHQRALLAPKGDRAGYLQRSIGPKRRKELRRQRHRLADGGMVSFALARTPSEVAPALRDFLALEAAGWKGRVGTAAAQHAGIAGFVERAVVALAARDQAYVARLTCGAAVVAAAVTLRSGNRAWGWKIAYDERHAAASPGVQLYLDLTEALLADPAIDCVDSCAVAGHPMIDHIWRERLCLADWLMALQPGAAFNVARTLEGARRRMLAVGRSLRTRLPG